MIKLYVKSAVVDRLCAFRRAGRFPHALMFCGETGCGKMTLCDYVSMLVLCEKGGEKPCEDCIPCRKAERHIHPDIVYVRDLIGGKYNVEGMRGVIADSSVLPNDGDIRIYVFENADEMSVICQNTLLKFIEEPSKFNRFVFTAASLSPVLPTILSRVTVIPVLNPTVSECEAALSDFGINAADSQKLSRIYDGNIGRCLCANENDDEKEILTAAENITTALAEKNEYNVAAAFSKLSERESKKKTLTLLLEVITNAMAMASAGITPEFLPEQTKKLARGVTLKNLSECADKINELIANSEFNPNVQLSAAANAVALTEMLYRN